MSVRHLSADQVAADDSRYPRLYETVADVIEAAVRSDILNQGFRPSTDGEYYIPSSQITLYPDGSMYALGEGWIPDLNGWSAGPRRDHFVTTIGEAFQRWDALPSRSASQGALDAASAASEAVSVTAASPKGLDIEAGDSRYQTALTQALTLQSYHGHAMDALNTQLTARLVPVAERQYAAVSVIGTALVAERQVWLNARHNVLTIADQALEAMRNANEFDGDGGGSGGFPDWLKVTGAIAAAAGLFFSGGAATALGGVGTIVKSLTTFGEAGATEEPPNPLGAPRPDDVVGKLVAAFQHLDEVITRAEDRIYDGCEHARSEIVLQSGEYSLATPAILGTDDTGRYVDGESTEFDLQTLEDIGEAYLPHVAAAILRGAGAMARADQAVAFDRPSGIGSNPYSSFLALLTEVDSCLRDTAWKVDRTGQQLALFARDFRALDEGRGADARRIEKRIDRQVGASRRGSGFHPVPAPVDRRPLPGGKVYAI